MNYFTCLFYETARCFAEYYINPERKINIGDVLKWVKGKINMLENPSVFTQCGRLLESFLRGYSLQVQIGDNKEVYNALFVV